MRKILLSEDALEDLNEGFLFYEAQDFGVGDYFSSCIRSDIEGLRFTAGIHRKIEGFHQLLSRIFPYQTVEKQGFSFVEISFGIEKQSAQE